MISQISKTHGYAFTTPDKILSSAGICPALAITPLNINDPKELNIKNAAIHHFFPPRRILASPSSKKTSAISRS